MKKKFILLLSGLLLCSSVMAETIFLYKQNRDNTLNTEIEQKTGENYNKNKIKNTFGSNRDYITAPSNVDYTNDISAILAKINDPYVIKINRTKYYMVKNSDNGTYTLNNIVGYGDSKTSLFSSLKALNSDADKTKITREELNNAGIRFVPVINGKLQLNDPSKDFKDILYIDISNTRESINNGIIGSFGYFDVYILDKNSFPKKIIGYVSFDSDDELTEMIK